MQRILINFDQSFGRPIDVKAVLVTQEAVAKLIAALEATKALLPKEEAAN